MSCQPREPGWRTRSTRSCDSIQGSSRVCFPGHAGAIAIPDHWSSRGYGQTIVQVFGGLAITPLKARISMRACALILVSLIGVLIALPTMAANKWSVGVNTLFVEEYALARGAQCSNCPSNVQPRTLAEIEAIINDLAINQHVRTFREIIPMELLSPNGLHTSSGEKLAVDSSNYEIIDSIISLFSKQKLHLLLAIGNPIPAWAAPWGNLYSCFLPPATDTAEFNILKNNIAWSVGNYLSHLKNIGYGEWMAGSLQTASSGGLFVEGFNEWNENASYKDCKDFAAATPQRAASLENAIGWVAKYYGVTVNFAAPSISFPSQGVDEWYVSYYAAGGNGAPNVHIYGNGLPNPGDSEAAVLYAKGQLKRLVNAVPSRYKAQVIWGETGFGEAGPHCDGTASLAADEWAKYDAAAAKIITGADSELTRAVQLFTVWRLDRLADQSSCEASIGIVTSDLVVYLPPASQMFRYLGGSGVRGKARQ